VTVSVCPGAGSAIVTVANSDTLAVSDVFWPAKVPVIVGKGLVTPFIWVGFSPDAAAPVTCNSCVPAVVPSVTQRPLSPCESMPLKTARLPIRANDVGFRPLELAPAGVNSTVPAEVPLVTQRDGLPELSNALNRTSLPNENRLVGGVGLADASANLMPGVANLVVPTAVPSVTQSDPVDTPVEPVVLPSSKASLPNVTRGSRMRLGSALLPLSENISVVPAEVPSVSQRLPFKLLS